MICNVMAACSAFGCTNRPSKKIQGITFHRFPANKERQEAWVKAVRRENWKPSKCSKLCSEHFTEDQIDRTSLCYVRLRENAVPNVFKAVSDYLQNGCHKKPARGRKKLIQCDLEETTENEKCKKNIEEKTAASATLTLKPVVVYVNACFKKEDKLSAKVTADLPISSVCAVSQNSNATENPLELQKKLRLAIDKISFMNKKLKIAQQKCRRLTKKVKSLKPALHFLKQKNRMTTQDLRTIFYDNSLEPLREL